MVVDSDNVSIISLEDFLYDTKARMLVEASLEPVAGATVIGDLPEPLIKDFVAAIHLHWQLDSFIEILKDRIAEESTGVVRAGLDGYADMEELQRLSNAIKVFRNDKEAYDYFKCLAATMSARYKLVLDIRTHFDNFTHGYDVRQGFRVVRLDKKYVL